MTVVVGLLQIDIKFFLFFAVFSFLSSISLVQFPETHIFAAKKIYKGVIRPASDDILPFSHQSPNLHRQRQAAMSVGPRQSKSSFCFLNIVD